MSALGLSFLHSALSFLLSAFHFGFLLLKALPDFERINVAFKSTDQGAGFMNG